MMMDKRIVVSIDDYVYRLNGQYYVDNVGYHIIGRYLSYFDHVKVIARCKICQDINELGQFTKVINAEKIEFCELPFFRGLSFFKFFLRINRIIRVSLKDHKYCIARVPSHTGFVVLFYGMMRRMVLGAEVVANPYQDYKTTGSFQSFLTYKVLCFFSKRVNGILFVTRHTLQRYYDFEIDGQISVGISDVELNKSFFSEYHFSHVLKNEKINICHISNIISGNSKGHYECLEVLKILKDNGVEAKILFAGLYNDPTPYINYAQKLGLRTNDIHFLGFVGKNELRSLLIDSDFMLFPSHSEGLPRVLLEAMSVGLPCITSNVGGIPEIISEDCCYNYSDIDGMAQKLLSLINNKEEYTRIAKRNYDEALKYDKENLQSLLNNYFDKITAL